MLWGATGGTALSPLFALAAGASVLAAVAVLFVRRRGRYDLESLREFHDREEVRQLEPDDPGDIDSLFCSNCGTAYSVRFPACPQCSKPNT